MLWDMTYAIQLGREPLLSLFEIEAMLHTHGVDAEIESVGTEIAFVRLSEFSQEMFSSLGGSVKLGVRMHHMPVKEFLAEPLALLADEEFMFNAFIDEPSISFAVNLFGDVPPRFRKQLKPLCLAWKKELKKHRKHVRFVESKEQSTSSVTVARNRLLRGCDLWIVFVRDEVTFVKTIAVQDYRAFSDRDFGRPRRNARNGMLPPKLARMMVNLSGARKGSVLHDPFVGSGTILQEAALLGIDSLIGTDIDEQNIKDAKANLVWLQQHSDKVWMMKFSRADVHALAPKEYLDVTHVVSEIDLGDPLLKPITIEEAQRRAQEAQKLIQAVWGYAAKLPKLESVTLAIPFWPQAKGDSIYVQFIKPEAFEKRFDISESRGFSQEISPRGGLEYMRKDQFVGREIFVLAKK